MSRDEVRIETLELRHAGSSPLALVTDGPSARCDHAIAMTPRHGASRLWLIRMHGSQGLAIVRAVLSETSGRKTYERVSIVSEV